MNFLNPLALLGMVAAGIPLLLHLLNLRRLRTVEFSSLRFLLELQQTQIRRIKIQQILLLLLRTLLIVFAVLAFARPTIPSRIPLLASSARSSVVIIVDNSASMEVADQRGVRFKQAQEAARNLTELLADGDEVAILPMAAGNNDQAFGFTRTFEYARQAIDELTVSSSPANLPAALQTANSLLADATHAHREVFVVSDAQVVSLHREHGDTLPSLAENVVVYLLNVGNGRAGIETNLSVDSVRLLTTLPQLERPVEFEAYIRNGSEKNIQGAMVSMGFNGKRVAQRTFDLLPGETRAVVLAAQPQHVGVTAVSVELENDALSWDNRRYAGITIPPPARIAVVGDGIGAELVTTALSLPAARSTVGDVRLYSTVAQCIPHLSEIDVAILVSAAPRDNDIPLLMQFMERGGGVVAFASGIPATAALLKNAGLAWDGVQKAPNGTEWYVRRIDDSHPLLEGVFKERSQKALAGAPRISQQEIVRGGIVIATSDVGPFLTEAPVGNGRLLFYAVGLDGSWGPFGGTGLFPALMVRSARYLSYARDVGASVLVGKDVSLTIPARYAAEPVFVVTDVTGQKMNIQPVSLPTTTILPIPAQRKPGVLSVFTSDSAAIGAISVNLPPDESHLEYLSEKDWLKGVQACVTSPDLVVSANGRSVEAAVRNARTGSELWPLCIVLAMTCAIAESLIVRFGARESEPSS